MNEIERAVPFMVLLLHCPEPPADDAPAIPTAGLEMRRHDQRRRRQNSTLPLVDELRELGPEADLPPTPGSPTMETI